MRTLDQPEGINPQEEETAYYNSMAAKMAERMLELLACGCLILLEQQLLSHLLCQKPMLKIIGLPGILLFRTDDCMHWALYRNPEYGLPIALPWLCAPQLFAPTKENTQKG